MVWLTFVFTLTRFIAELPEFNDVIQKVFAKWATIPELKHKGEAKRLTAAMRESLLNKLAPSFTAAGTPQPLEAYLKGLEHRHPAAV